MPLFRPPWPKPPEALDADTRHATQLLNAAMAYARLILKRYGQLAPFGFSMDRDGNVARETIEIPRLPRDPERMFKLLTEHVAERIRRGLDPGRRLVRQRQPGQAIAGGIHRRRRSDDRAGVRARLAGDGSLQDFRRPVVIICCRGASRWESWSRRRSARSCLRTRADADTFSSRCRGRQCIM